MFRRRWDDSMIINHILSKHGREPLNSHYYATTYPDVYAAADRLFGSWKDAIEACGLNYAEIRKYREWSITKILEEIKNAYKAKKSLNSKYIQDNNRPLYMAAIKRFKSWGNAVHAAGLDYKKIRIRRKMSVAEIKEEVITLFNKKVDMAYSNMRENYQYLLASAMKKVGDGSWAAARRKCGILINYRLPRHKRFKHFAEQQKKNQIAAAAKAARKSTVKPVKKTVAVKAARKPVKKVAAPKKAVKKAAPVKTARKPVKKGRRS